MTWTFESLGTSGHHRGVARHRADHRGGEPATRSQGLSPGRGGPSISGHLWAVDVSQAAQSRRLARPEGGPGDGRLHHTCYGDTSALRVTDVYDTQRSFDAFGQVLMPILGELRIDVGRPDIVEVHNIIRG